MRRRPRGPARTAALKFKRRNSDGNGGFVLRTWHPAWAPPIPATVFAQSQRVRDGHARSRIKQEVANVVADSLPTILIRHGVADHASTSDVIALQESIARTRADAEFRRADVLRAKAAHGFRAEDLHACKAAASKLVKYASGSRPRDPTTPASQREKITNQLNLSRIIRLAALGLTNAAEIADRIDQGTNSIEDLEQLIEAIDRLAEHVNEARGRRDSPLQRIVSDGLDVWVGSGQANADRQRAPLVAFIQDLFELSGHPQGSSEVDQRAARDDRFRKMLKTADAHRRRVDEESAVQKS